ncbi:cytochrome bd-I ubiquinol oxidase subunit 2 apoprotein [Actinomyces ruminicola]|uniref:Cytochrome bd-I ubiquinol oxidase subunit 2 apoprotein n=1 Tax=Actinomyces ruminicola TaxID=332524 RepID=A0A1H0BV93_9ACTO|nr:cytochrome d ubiquinol oxidase subunit II [Actinomyces ruminicola]SDN49584.1 cytochrome bd-I ubiquinol oxidase subunit 2 apoprotein [Actinomyces ruminicola]
MTLSVLWFILIAILWVGYLTLEGFDFGVGMLLKILGRDERERRAMVQTIGPHWDGNEVWLLTAGGATFAAFPEWYGTLFSGAYLVLFIILLCLIVRVCAIEWRGKINAQSWRDRWDWAHTVAAWLPAILWGAAFANLVQGMQIEVVDTASGAPVPAAEVPADALVAGASHQVTGGFFSLITPFTLLGGAATCLLFLTHGALFTALKTAGDLSVRAAVLARRCGIASTLVAAAWGVWAVSYSATAWAWLPLTGAAAALAGSLICSFRGRQGLAFGLHFAAIAGVVALVFTAMAPDVMRSSIDPAYSLTITQAASADTTLAIMTVVAVVFLPVVLFYTVWGYRTFAARVNAERIDPTVGGLHPTRVRDNALAEAAAR